MKRFALFQFHEFYPSGGWGDYRGSFDSQEEAILACASGYDDTQVVDLESGKVVYES